MKYFNKILVFAALGIGATALTGCLDETEPESATVTQKQVENSTLATEAAVLAMPAYFNHFDDAIVDRGWHYPFGYGANMYIRDLMTGDMGHDKTNYASHFYYWAQNKYQGDGYVFCQYVFNYYYGFVLTINTAIGAVDPENATDQQLGWLGAAYAFRALAYLDLARTYEFLPNDKFPDGKNKDGNIVTNLTVPIVTESMAVEETMNNPRAKREDMFNFILSDLDNAEKYIVNLHNYVNNTLPDMACVYGLKARLYMWVEDYANAQKYARLAIDNARVQPMTEDDCLDPATGFNTISKWMWGSQQTKEDDTVSSGIINWTSWLSNQTTFGYTGFAEANMPYNVIDQRMYDRISNTDFRKLEFLAPEDSPLRALNRLIPGTEAAINENMTPLAALKFRPNAGNYKEYTTGAASAYPVMRVEEMYFIEAEAAAHQNPEQGKQLCIDFMKNYRDPNYNIGQAVDLIDEIVFQKRVELWGEGQTFFDIKRLNMSVTRGYSGTNFYSTARLNTVGRPAWMNFVLIRSEENVNKAVVGWNNPDPSDLYTPWTE
ncbi:MAG: RagB/SusD family nutrient uptake outer membrane protein [Bacteroidaceae bacterium]|nr:RagB/SusD family nutrient uptake outer membrane protein [Bacteroidaceae bacterium]